MMDEETRRPMRADARRNYDRLIDAARDAFAERGVEAPLDDIAKRAGVGPGTLYRHFPTREDLLVAVYRHEVAALRAEAQRLSETLPPAEALSAWVDVQLDYMKSKHGLGSAVKAMLGADSPVLNICRDEMRASAEVLLRPAREAGVIRPDLEGKDLLRLLHALAVAAENYPEDLERLLGFVLEGLRPQRVAG